MDRAYAAATAAVFSKQNPHEHMSGDFQKCLWHATAPLGPAWCPGGRAATKTASALPAATRSTASNAAPHPPNAARNDPAQSRVSVSRHARCAGASGVAAPSAAHLA